MLVRFAGILAVGMLASHMAFAASCVKPADISAFTVAGLKSRLMVTALSCRARAKYTAFVAHFRPGLLKQEHRLKGYFARSYGRRGGQEHDLYVTSLANAQSRSATRQGAAFCDQGFALFRQVMALDKKADLADFAAGKGLIQPIALIACPAPLHVIRTAQAGAGAAAPTP